MPPTSANQTNASQKTQIVDGSGNVIASTSNNLDVQCANCSGSGVSTADGASWTSGSSLFAGIGGFYQTTLTSNPLTAGHQGFAQLTPYRSLFTDWYNSSGVEMGTSSSPVQVSLANTGANATAVSTNPGTAANWALFADNSAWSVNTTLNVPMGCEYTSGGATALTTAHVGTPGCTSARQQFVALFGNTGAVMDVAIGGATAAANALQVGGVYNSSAPTLHHRPGRGAAIDCGGLSARDSR